MKPMKLPPLYIAVLLSCSYFHSPVKNLSSNRNKMRWLSWLPMVTGGSQDYLENQTNNITASFAGYAFQFNENGTVYGIVWSATNGRNLVSRCECKESITSNFPSAPFPMSNAELYLDYYRTVILILLLLRRLQTHLLIS